MKLSVKRIFKVVLLMSVLLISSQVTAQEPSQGDQASAVKADTPPETLELADVVPLATEFTVRLATLERAMKHGLDVSAVEKAYAELQTKLEDYAGQFQRMKDSKKYSYNKLVDLREGIRQDSKLFHEISKPMSRSIRHSRRGHTSCFYRHKI
ncbi:MAG: hypothetical protein JW902_11955 [Syntrophaceae bacterium]|nr:hypothetical protein [Syntrophaceae bacterium]